MKTILLALLIFMPTYAQRIHYTSNVTITNQYEMKASKKIVEFISYFESFRATPYYTNI